MCFFVISFCFLFNCVLNTAGDFEIINLLRLIKRISSFLKGLIQMCLHLKIFYFVFSTR